MSDALMDAALAATDPVLASGAAAPSNVADTEAKRLLKQQRDRERAEKLKAALFKISFPEDEQKYGLEGLSTDGGAPPILKPGEENEWTRRRGTVLEIQRRPLFGAPPAPPYTMDWSDALVQGTYMPSLKRVKEKIAMQMAEIKLTYLFLLRTQPTR